MSLAALFDQTHKLPTIPKVVQELIESFNNDKVSTEEITKKISADPVLTAKLLRLANSAYYHVSRTVSSVDDAVMLLGFVAVRTLVISTGITGSFKDVGDFDQKAFWRYSLNTAVMARWLAKQAKQNTDLAFTVGLMHGIGQLLMRSVIPKACIELDKSAGPLDGARARFEREALGYDFAEVGAELAARWKFPQAFVDGIRNAPYPLQREPLQASSALTHLGSYLARCHDRKATTEWIRAEFPADVAVRLKLSVDVLKDMPPLNELTAGMEDLIG
jgi:HD-like signal output (HDOD) protein